MNTWRSIPANYVVLNHTVSIICIFHKQNVSLLRELYYYAWLHVSAILDAVIMFQNI